MKPIGCKYICSRLAAQMFLDKFLEKMFLMSNGYGRKPEQGTDWYSRFPAITSFFSRIFHLLGYP